MVSVFHRERRVHRAGGGIRFGGKSTIARMVTHLEQTTSGEIFMNEEKCYKKAKGKELRNLYQNLQMVFQNPSDSF